MNGVGSGVAQFRLKIENQEGHPQVSKVDRPDTLYRCRIMVGLVSENLYFIYNNSNIVTNITLRYAFLLHSVLLCCCLVIRQFYLSLHSVLFC